jgi:hypothetical protein
MYGKNPGQYKSTVVRLRSVEGRRFKKAFSLTTLDEYFPVTKAFSCKRTAEMYLKFTSELFQCH